MNPNYNLVTIRIKYGIFIILNLLCSQVVFSVQPTSFLLDTHYIDVDHERNRLPKFDYITVNSGIPDPWSYLPEKGMKPVKLDDYDQGNRCSTPTLVLPLLNYHLQTVTLCLFRDTLERGLFIQGAQIKVNGKQFQPKEFFHSLQPVIGFLKTELDSVVTGYIINKNFYGTIRTFDKVRHYHVVFYVEPLGNAEYYKTGEVPKADDGQNAILFEYVPHDDSPSASPPGPFSTGTAASGQMSSTVASSPIIPAYIQPSTSIQMSTETPITQSLTSTSIRTTSGSTASSITKTRSTPSTEQITTEESTTLQTTTAESLVSTLQQTTEESTTLQTTTAESLVSTLQQTTEESTTLQTTTEESLVSTLQQTTEESTTLQTTTAESLVSTLQQTTEESTTLQTTTAESLVSTLQQTTEESTTLQTTTAESLVSTLQQTTEESTTLQTTTAESLVSTLQQTTEESTTLQTTTAESLVSTLQQTTEESTTLQTTTAESLVSTLQQTTEESTTLQTTTAESSISTFQTTTKEGIMLQTKTEFSTTQLSTIPEMTTLRSTTFQSTMPPSTTTEPSTTDPSTTEESTTLESTSLETTTEPSIAEASTTEPSTTEESTTLGSTTLQTTTEPSITKVSTIKPSTAEESTTLESTTLQTTTELSKEASTTEASTTPDTTTLQSTTLQSTTEDSLNAPSTSGTSKSKSKRSTTLQSTTEESTTLQTTTADTTIEPSTTEESTTLASTTLQSTTPDSTVEPSTTEDSTTLQSTTLQTTTPETPAPIRKRGVKTEVSYKEDVEEYEDSQTESPIANAQSEFKMFPEPQVLDTDSYSDNDIFDDDYSESTTPIAMKPIKPLYFKRSTSTTSDEYENIDLDTSTPPSGKGKKRGKRAISFDNLDDEYSDENILDQGEDIIDEIILTVDDTEDGPGDKIGRKAYQCPLCIWIQPNFADKFGLGGGLNYGVGEVIDLVKFLNWVFRTTDFNQDGLPENIGFAIQEITVTDDVSVLTPELIDPPTADPRSAKVNVSKPDCNVTEEIKFSRGIKTLTPKSAMLTASKHLKKQFAHCCITLGFYYHNTAPTFSATNLRGLCSDKSIGIISGYLHAHKIGKYDVYRGMIHVVSHLFGGNHDIVSWKECQDPQMYRFLNPFPLHPVQQINVGIRPNSFRFSSCSKFQISYFLLKTRPNCLQIDPRPTFCGNGILESGEECDCGTLWQCHLRKQCCGERDSLLACRKLNKYTKKCTPPSGW